MEEIWMINTMIKYGHNKQMQPYYKSLLVQQQERNSSHRNAIVQQYRVLSVSLLNITKFQGPAPSTCGTAPDTPCTGQEWPMRHVLVALPPSQHWAIRTCAHQSHTDARRCKTQQGCSGGYGTAQYAVKQNKLLTKLVQTRLFIL